MTIILILYRTSAVSLWEHGQWTLNWTLLWRHKGSNGKVGICYWGKLFLSSTCRYFIIQTSHSSITVSPFHFQVEKESMQTTYTENDRSMLRYVYDCVFFVARKPSSLHFKNQTDDQHPSSPPAAKSPRQEDADRFTWHKRKMMNFDPDFYWWSKVDKMNFLKQKKEIICGYRCLFLCQMYL